MLDSACHHCAVLLALLSPLPSKIFTVYSNDLSRCECRDDLRDVDTATLTACSEAPRQWACPKRACSR
eukprot:Skav225842  [mRNA]  locus=scaffold345:126384:126587:- [translate_table: standard]